jgi:hypothetical protein
MGKHRKRIISIAFAAAVCALLAPAAASALPPTLTREFFGGTPTVTATCAASGSMIFYSVSGVAVGPYPGTFTESGTATIGPFTAGNSSTDSKPGSSRASTPLSPSIRLSDKSPARSSSGYRAVPSVSVTTSARVLFGS